MMTPKRVYLIGSLRNPAIPTVAKRLREVGLDVFDDWHAAGENADDLWKKYEQGRGRTYLEAMNHGWHAAHTFQYDRNHLDLAQVGVLVLPAGKSGHLELGYMIGQGKPGYVLLDDPERWELMLRFATLVPTLDELVELLRVDS